MAVVASVKTDVRDERLAARLSGGGAGVDEERKPRTVVSLTLAPPPYNRPRFHRVVRAERSGRNVVVLMGSPFRWRGPDDDAGWSRTMDSVWMWPGLDRGPWKTVTVNGADIRQIFLRIFCGNSAYTARILCARKHLVNSRGTASDL